MIEIRELLAIACSHYQAKRFPMAEEIYQQIVTIDPENADSWHALSSIAHHAGRHQVAVEHSTRAINSSPNVPAFYCNLGAALAIQQKLDQAVPAFRRALQLDPHFAEAHYNLGKTLAGQGKLDEAVAAYQRAIELRPNYAEAYNDLGNAWAYQGHLDEAVPAYRKALELEPTFVKAHSNLGSALRHQCRLDESLAAYERALELQPAFIDAHCNRSRAWLLTGDFERGWSEYEWRWKRKDTPPRQWPQPKWDGSPLEGRSIVLHWEQGFGDMLQFVRYAQLVKAAGGTVLFECQRALIQLLQRTPGIDVLIPAGTALPEFDVFAPLMSLPDIFKTTLDTVPRKIPYVFANESLVAMWKERLQQQFGNQFKVGINWQGSLTYKRDQFRSVVLSEFAPLAIPGVQLISLQKGAGEEQLSDAPFPVANLGPGVDGTHGPFMDTAAVMKNLDLVITVDTSIAHLAGAMGVPVWVAIPFAPDWRWLLNRDDSPWYPTMRLFRQPQLGDWRSVFARMAVELNATQSFKEPLVLTDESTTADVSRALATAVAHHQAGRLPMAKQIYLQVLKVAPENADAWHLLGFIEHHAGNHQLASEQIGRAITCSPNVAMFHSNLGVALAAHGRLNEAIAAFHQAVQLAPDYADAHYNLGKALEDEGTLDEAVAAYRRTLDLKPEYAHAHNNLGNLLRRQGKLEEAISAYRRALELRPTFAEAYNNLGSALRDHGTLIEAVSAYQKALELNPTYAEAYSNLGNALRDQGKFDEAVAAYRRALDFKPDFAEVHNSIGNTLVAQGRLGEAVTTYRRISDSNPDLPEAHANLGNALRLHGKLEEAVVAYRRALELKPDYAEVYSNLGLALLNQGKVDEAVAAFPKALQLNPDCVEVYNNLGVALKDRGKLDEAVASYRQALELKPDYPEAHSNLGMALMDQGKLNEAIAAFRLAARFNPEFAEAHNNLGVALMAGGKLNDAVAAFRRAVRFKPEYTEAHNNLGVALKDRGQFDEAISAYQRALELKPDYVEAHSNLGNALRHQGKLDEAIAACRRAVEMNPSHAGAHNNLGVVLLDRCKVDEALAEYERALELNPDFAEAHSNRSHARLLTGDFERGWQEYEWRWKKKDSPPRQWSQPNWDGSPLEGRSIVLHWEQGLGDMLQFVRYAQLVKEAGGIVYFECQPALQQLLKRTPGIDRLISAGTALPDFDVFAPLMSLPRLLKSKLDTVPRRVPYVFADETLIGIWKDRLQAQFGKQFKVGINWQGSPTYKRDQFRSVSLCEFSCLAIAGVELISLQKGAGTEQLRSASFSVSTLGPDLDEKHGPFMDTAAVLQNLDLVVTVDTSIAHLAGAMGVPVWVALPFAPDWRWMLNRDDSPWYPTMRLFRQLHPGDWCSVFAMMADQLRAQISRGPDSGVTSLPSITRTRNVRIKQGTPSPATR